MAFEVRSPLLSPEMVEYGSEKLGARQVLLDSMPIFLIHIHASVKLNRRLKNMFTDLAQRLLFRIGNEKPSCFHCNELPIERYGVYIPACTSSVRIEGLLPLHAT